MRFFLITIISVLSSLNLFSQELAVKSFQLNDGDLSARTEKRVDLNGNLCALIKVEAIPTCEFGGYVVGSVEKKLGAYWVYICAQNPVAHKLVVSSDNFKPLEVEFSRFGITSIEAGSTYTLRIDVKMDSSIIQRINENKLLKYHKDLTMSPFYNLRGERIQINKCIKKLRTILLADYYHIFTMQKADEYCQKEFKSKYVLFFKSRLELMGSFQFPMNLTKFERNDFKYSLTFEQYDNPPITLEIHYIPESQSYKGVFINVDGDKFEATFHDLQLSSQASLWNTVYKEDVFANLIPGKTKHPYLFDLLDYWKEKYCK